MAREVPGGGAIFSFLCYQFKEQIAPFCIWLLKDPCLNNLGELMTVRATETKLSYFSNPAWQRPAFIPTIFFLSAIWIFSITLATVVVMGLLSGTALAIGLWVLAPISVVLITYMYIYTKKYVNDLARKYEFEMTDNEIQLRIDDRVSGRRYFAHMPYSEMSFVEHYTPRDNASLVFHGSLDRIVEVPIWSMTADVSDILDLLSHKRIKVVTL